MDEEDICRWSLKNGLNNYFAVLDKSRKVLTFTDEQGNKIKELERKLQDIHNYLVSRQGDECEKKIAELEEQFDCLENDLRDYGIL